MEVGVILVNTVPDNNILYPRLKNRLFVTFIHSFIQASEPFISDLAVSPRNAGTKLVLQANSEHVFS